MDTQFLVCAACVAVRAAVGPMGIAPLFKFVLQTELGQIYLRILGSFRGVSRRRFDGRFVVLWDVGFKTISPHWRNGQGGKSRHVSGVYIVF